MTTAQAHEAARIYIPMISWFIIIGSCVFAWQACRFLGMRRFRRGIAVQVAAACRSSRTWASVFMLAIVWATAPHVRFAVQDWNTLQMLFLTAITFAVALQTILPPVALVLATSQEEGGGMVLGQALMAFRPLKVAALLRRSALPPLGDAALWTTRYRTVRGVSWERQVTRLLDIVPLVIYDARFPTEHMRTELQVLDTYSRQYALFVIHDEMDESMEITNAGYVKGKPYPVLHVSVESVRFYAATWMKVRRSQRQR